MLGENPFLSDPNVNKVRKALANLDFLVVQDIFLTETAEFADVILPATSYLEKIGTYTNTDRRVQIGRPVLDPPGQARLDWQIICEIATRIGLPHAYDGARKRSSTRWSPLDQSLAGLTLREPRRDRQALPEPRPGAVRRHRRPLRRGLPHGRRQGASSFRPSGCRRSELPDDELPVRARTRAACWSTGTRAR